MKRTARTAVGAIVGLLFVLTGSLVVGQTSPPKNPSLISFNCPDHALDDQHEIDIVRESDGVIVQTILGGDPPLNAAGAVEVSVNVMPVAFGQYRFVVRAVAGTLRSANSAPSVVWERVPGRPTNLVVGSGS